MSKLSTDRIGLFVAASLPLIIALAFLRLLTHNSTFKIYSCFRFISTLIIGELVNTVSPLWNGFAYVCLSINIMSLWDWGTPRFPNISMTSPLIHNLIFIIYSLPAFVQNMVLMSAYCPLPIFLLSNVYTAWPFPIIC